MGSSIALYRKRLSEGKCGGCGCRPREDGKTRCSVCNTRRQDWYLRNRGDGVRNRSEVTLDPLAHKRASEKYRRLNRDKSNMAVKASKLREKIDVLENYGGAICACCGEDTIDFLTLDHINGAGHAHRKEFTKGHPSRFYVMLKRAGYPDEGLRVLCMNCNWGRRHNQGMCPHEIQRECMQKELAAEAANA